MKTARFRFRRAVALALFPLAGCDLDGITVTQTLSVEELLLTVVRGLVIAPLDAALTDAVQNAVGDEDEP